MKNNNKKIILVFVLVLFISIGFSFLTSDLSISGLSFIKKNTWDVHFANIVDDSFSSEVNNPATISSNGKKVNFEVTFNNPGEEYYFYVDVVNEGTLDAMLDLYEVTGLSDEQKNYIEWEITYSDGIELTKYDKLPKDSKDTLKVLVRFKDNIDVSVLPDNNEAINLTFKSIYVQADKSANERTTVEDKTAPDINFAAQSSQSIKGNNKWYKSLSVLSKLVDPSGIKSVKYCATTTDACTPNQTADIKNNSISLQLSNNALGQIVCVEGIDVKDNNDVVCSKEKYYVDGEEPNITNVTANSLDDTISITVAAQDEHSGINKYYYSKDGGRSYISSKDNNYTFAGLEPDDYIVMDYVEDNAGNTSSTNTTTSTVRIRSWCEKNEITTLSDCAIAQGMNNKNVEVAKQEIEDRGEPDFSTTSPAYTYKEKISSAITEYGLNSYQINVANSYDFSESTGYYTLKNSQLVDPEQINLSDGKEYYFMPNNSDYSINMYKIISITKQQNNMGTYYYVIKKINYSFDVKSYNNQSLGLYATDDDYGTSYYYRGSVGGNYVKFADLYWKILRINGDGTVRLIYYGDTPTTGDNAFMTPFNFKFQDPTYNGFMFNDKEFSSNEIISENTTYTNVSPNGNYYYGKDYVYDDVLKSYKIKGTVEENTVTSGVWNDNYERIIDGGYLYTCFSTEINGSCEVMMKINGYRSSSSAYVNYISHSSTSYESAVKNLTLSKLAALLNEWFDENIKEKSDLSGQLYTNYLSDRLFCNDRSLSIAKGNGDGYSLVPNTFYGGQDRIIDNKKPSLICPLKNDKFTVAESDNGNGALANYNPVGLITVDEVALAGGVFSKTNPLYFLNYGNNKSFYTMTPAMFSSGTRAATFFGVDKTGMINKNWAPSAGDGGVRPVINLSKNVLVAGGDGTQDNPYTVKLP